MKTIIKKAIAVIIIFALMFAIMKITNTYELYKSILVPIIKELIEALKN